MAGARAHPSPLHEMLGLPPDASPERLRFAYDQAMAAATRLGDRNRALALSRAFDALPAGRRTQLYRPAGTTTVAPRLPASTGYTASPAPRRRARRCSRVSAVSALTALLMLPVVCFGAPRFVSYLNQARDTAAVPAVPVSAVPSVPAPYVPPVRIVRVPHVRRVPDDAPTDGAGYVDVTCRPHHGRRGETIFAHPGSLVRCPNGAIPRIIR